MVGKHCWCTASAQLLELNPTDSKSALRDGATTAKAQCVKELEREVKKLRRANEILNLASTFS